MATPPPTAAELVQAARTVLLGQRLPGPALPRAALTHGLCAELAQAVNAAMQSPEVIAHRQGKSADQKPLLGLVAASLLGLTEAAELREPGAWAAAGRRLATTARDHVSRLSKISKSASSNKLHMKKRHKGTPAELEERLAAAARAVEQRRAEERGRLAASLLGRSSSAALPIDAAAAQQHELVEGPRVTTGMQGAAASLVAIAAPAAPAAAMPRAWTCPRCSQFEAEKAAACEAASVALQAKFTAEHMRSAAYVDLQAARQQLRDRIAELEAQHARALEGALKERDAAHVLALEQRDAAHAAALLAAQEAVKEARAIAELRRKEAVQARQHQSTLSTSTFQERGELQKLKKKLETAAHKEAILKAKHGEELEALRGEAEAARREAATAGLALGPLIQQAEQHASVLRAEQTRRGVAETALKRLEEAGGTQQQHHSVRTAVPKLQKQLLDLEAQQRGLEAVAAEAGTRIAVLGKELALDEKEMARKGLLPLQTPYLYKARQVRAPPCPPSPTPSSNADKTPAIRHPHHPQHPYCRPRRPQLRLGRPSRRLRRLHRPHRLKVATGAVSALAVAYTAPPAAVNADTPPLFGTPTTHSTRTAAPAATSSG